MGCEQTRASPLRATTCRFCDAVTGPPCVSQVTHGCHHLRAHPGRFWLPPSVPSGHQPLIHLQGLQLPHSPTRSPSWSSPCQTDLSCNPSQLEVLTKCSAGSYAAESQGRRVGGNLGNVTTKGVISIAQEQWPLLGLTTPQAVSVPCCSHHHAEAQNSYGILSPLSLPEIKAFCPRSLKQYLSCPHNVWVSCLLQAFPRSSSRWTRGSYSGASEDEKS